MSDDPQSEMERNRLLEERDRLMKAQQHLERVLGGGSVEDNDQEMYEVEPQEAVSRITATEMTNGNGMVKTESSRAPQTPGMFGVVETTIISNSPVMLTTTSNTGKRKRSPEMIVS
jgi:hypothetical protein